MEKKDWRGDLLKIGEIPDGSEETTFVEFHLDTLNNFIKKVVDKAREEGYENGVKDGMKGRVFKKVHITEEYKPFKNRGELEEFLKSGNVAFKIDKEVK